MQLKLHMVTMEDLMPQEHFLRKLDGALDLSFVRRETADLYSRRYGRPPIDPVVLVKYLLVGYLYGIPSERQIEQRLQTDIALRWYLGLDLFDAVPDHSTISQLRRRKPSFRKVFRRLFEEVVRQCVAAGLVSGRLAVTDSTHVKRLTRATSQAMFCVCKTSFTQQFLPMGVFILHIILWGTLMNEFKSILKQKNTNALAAWMDKTAALGLPELNAFTAGLKHDIDTVYNAVSSDYSNGLVEGTVNKIKVVKRIMYVRCHFQLP